MVFIFSLVCLAALSTTSTVEGSISAGGLTIPVNPAGAGLSHVSCIAGGNFLCTESCKLQGKPLGGCCGKYGKCWNTCYCKGSGLEYRCNECDFFG